MELKFNTTFRVHKAAASFNRTFMELKLGIDIGSLRTL